MKDEKVTLIQSINQSEHF